MPNTPTILSRETKLMRETSEWHGDELVDGLSRADGLSQADGLSRAGKWIAVLDNTTIYYKKHLINHSFEISITKELVPAFIGPEIQYTPSDKVTIAADFNAKHYLIGKLVSTGCTVTLNSKRILILKADHPFALITHKTELVYSTPFLKFTPATPCNLLESLIFTAVSYPKSMQKLYVAPPKGILLHGLIGVGKTHAVFSLAKKFNIKLVTHFNAVSPERSNCSIQYKSSSFTQKLVC
jgi:hypothetical protein